MVGILLLFKESLSSYPSMKSVESQIPGQGRNDPDSDAENLEDIEDVYGPDD